MRSSGKYGVSCDADRCTQTKHSTHVESKTNDRSKIVYLERGKNTFSTADESYGSSEEVQSIERSASSLLRSAILFKKREKAGLPRTSGNEVETKDNTTSLQKMRRLRKENSHWQRSSMEWQFQDHESMAAFPPSMLVNGTFARPALRTSSGPRCSSIEFWLKLA